MVFLHRYVHLLYVNMIMIYQVVQEHLLEISVIDTYIQARIMTKKMGMEYLAMPRI